MAFKSVLFSPLQLRDVQFKNRIFMSPMCQYSATDGVPDNWHLVHLGSRAVGGAALVMVEATAVRATGRISSGDLGLWNDAQRDAFKPIVKFIAEQGAVAGIQLGHAGRKASTLKPWEGNAKLPLENGGWKPDAPSPIEFSPTYHVPNELSPDEMNRILNDFAASTKRAVDAGFQVLELHFAHGYLPHEFLSPLSNYRTDEYGGSLQNRMRYPLKIAKTVREVWPSNLPLFVRISATDWADGGWDVEQSIAFSKELKTLGVDFIDCSSGGTVAHPVIPTGPGYQVQFATAVKNAVGISTGAVGFITEAAQAEFIVGGGFADAVSLAREFLRDPYFPLNAAKKLGVDIDWPEQYDRGKKEALGR